MNKTWIFTTCLVMAAVGCTPVQKGAGTGAVAGGALGGIIGHQSGRGGTGAAIGAAVGGITGAVIAEKMQKKFCPEGGETYGAEYNVCPIHGVDLKEKQQ